MQINIVDWLISCNVVEKIDKELYSYGVYSLFLSLSPLLLAIGLGIGMGRIKQSIMVVIPFVIIRKFSGGYHTQHLWTCLICSCLLLFLCVVSSFYVKCGWELAGITVGAAISLIGFSPIESENRELSIEESIRYKKITMMLVAIFLLLDVTFFVFHLHIYSVCVSIGIILSASLQFPSVLKGLMKKLEHPN